MPRYWIAAALLGALAPTSAHADVKAGVDRWERGDYSGAIREWRPLAISGDADAQFNMGQAYKLGRGVPVDASLAEDWYRKAAAQGHLQAEDNYGLILFQNGNRKAAMPYIEESAGRGEPRAQYVYGTALFNGDMVAKDWVRAYALMTRASAAGIPAASASLAQMDKYIPLDQRQRGLQLARVFENAASKPKFAEAGTIVREALPPSKPARAARPVSKTPIVKPEPKVLPKPVLPKAVAAKAPPPRVAAPTPAPGKWRIQLAAIDDAGRAVAAWSGFKTRIPALAPFSLVTERAGAFTRIQAGPLPSRDAALRLCAAVKAKGQACLPVER